MPDYPPLSLLLMLLHSDVGKNKKELFFSMSCIDFMFFYNSSSQNYFYCPFLFRKKWTGCMFRVYVQKTEKKKQQPYPAGQPSLFMVRCHTESLNKELYSFVNAVLIIKTQASNVKCICIRGIQSQDITVKTDLLLWQCKSIYLCSFRNFIRLLHETLATWMSLTLVRYQVWCAQTMQWPLNKYAT